ncbi:MAG TPA: hypothetical protein VJH23_05445 [archaeon]|nr:hypothetical protein [archaeon]
MNPLSIILLGAGIIYSVAILEFFGFPKQADFVLNCTIGFFLGISFAWWF